MANTDWIEGRYLRQRRNLNAISIALSIYILAGGFIESGTPTQLASGFMLVNLKNPEIVVNLVWISLFYFMWRFWLSAIDLRDAIKKQRTNAYHWTPYVRNLINETITKYHLQKNVAQGQVAYKTGSWVLVFGRVKADNVEEYVDVPDRKLPIIPFAFIAWLAEIKTAWRSSEFSEYYMPFFLAWFAILSAFIWPLIQRAN